MAKRITEELSEIERNFEIVVKDSNVKYSRFGFGTLFTNIHYLLTDKLTTSDKALKEYFSMTGPIYHVSDGEFEYVGLSIVNRGEDIYQINLKHV